MTKLDTIAEADAAGRIDYQANKAQDAKEAAIAQVKKYASIPLDQIPRLANAIDPKTGVIYYGDASREGSGDGNPKMMPLKFMSQADQKPMMDALTLAGLKVVPHEVKQLFGTGQYAKVEPAALQQVISGPVTPAPTPDKPADKPADPGQDPTDANMIELDKLRDRLLATLSGQGPQPSPDVVTPPVKDVVKTPVEKEKTLGQKAGIGAGMVAGGLTGAALGKKYGGKFGAALGGITGTALGGMGVNAIQPESIQYNSSIAQSLTESFGYEFEDQELDEYSMDQFKTDAGDTLRGAAQGATLGTYDNIAAGVKSAFGPGTYRDELAKQTAASKEAEKRNPALYTAGNIAGSFAAPIPGGAIAAGVGRLGGGMLAKGATTLGANLLAQKGVDVVKQASDIKTLGYDPTKYPKTPQEVMAFQKANGLTADGKIGPKTNAVLAKMGLTPATVAEDIKSIQDKLAMIENGQWRLEEDADYRVWLLEDNTVIDDHGNQITDESMLDAIEWDQARLDELSLSGMGKSLGRGYDAVANVGKNFVGGLKGQNATGNLIKGTEKNFASRMAAPKANGKVRSAAEIARDSTNARGTANLANKAANYVGKNPGKVALGAAALGTAGVAAANALGSGQGGDTTDKPVDKPVNKPVDKPVNTPVDTPVDKPVDTPVDKPTAGELTPEQKEIIAKMQKIIQGVGATEDEGLLSHLAPANAAIQKATQMAGSAKPATSGQAASPAGTTSSPTQTITLPKVPAGTTVDKTGVTPPVKESAEDELARWLRIARG
jgi:hypothetical protein